MNAATQAHAALADRSLTSAAVDAQFFARSTIWKFADGSRLVENFASGRSYVEAA